MSQEDDRRERNKRLVREITELVWNARAFDRIPDFYAAEYVADYRPFAPLREGHAGIRGMVERAWAAFPDYHEELHELVAEDDRVVARFSISGTQQGAWGLLPPTGKRVRFEEIVILEIRDGKVCRQHGVVDNLTALRQLGMLPSPPAFAIRIATPDDVPVLERLIAASARGLSRQDYTDAQIEAALGTAWGVDSELIADGTYFAVEAAGEVVACGGWSKRATLFGADAQPGRRSELLDPARDAARIRAFFVRPDWARRGIGRALIERCESEARAHGFRAFELMATLPGRRLYVALGYAGERRVAHPLPGGLAIDFVPMRKEVER